MSTEPTKSAGEVLKEQLFLERKHLATELTDAQIEQSDRYCDGYKSFLDQAKTEREVVDFAEAAAITAGFVPFDANQKYNAGQKIYYINRRKAIILAVIGSHPLSDGVRITAAHIDSPRLDLKPNPLYEDNELALFKTHYYGGIKKYQWTAIPLALHGRIVKKDQSFVDVKIGEDDADPVFCITDLLPHLAEGQMKKTLNEAIEGEGLNILVGSRPFRDDKVSEKIKLNILSILHQKYQVSEHDFLSAELEFVPAFKAKDIGFDRSMIGAYGHDDRVCAYPALTAILELTKPEYTAITILADKEEIGSFGNTGLNSSYLQHFISHLAYANDIRPETVLANSQCLSADVNAGFDPNYPEVNEPRNCAFLNKGVVVTKYTGARGKSGTSDASAEFTGTIRHLFDQHNIRWQTGELGKVDAGGGGTVAMYIAQLDIDVIDVGVPVLSMHAPFEVASKLDIYMAHRAFFAFFE